MTRGHSLQPWFKLQRFEVHQIVIVHNGRVDLNGILTGLREAHGPHVKDLVLKPTGGGDNRGAELGSSHSYDKPIVSRFVTGGIADSNRIFAGLAHLYAPGD